MTYKVRLLRIGYVLGISLILASIIYFFAANWGGLERLQKIWLSGGLISLFYGMSFLPALWPRLSSHRDFLARLLLLGGLITFGIAVALIGQTYNSHADSFALFLIWCIPAILLSIITRHNWFYLTTYVLAHITIWFYFFPSSVFIDHSYGKIAFIYGIFALINLLLFILCERGLLRSNSIRYVSFIIFHTAVLWLSNSFVLDTIGYTGNIVALAAIAGSFYYFSQLKLDKWALSVTGLAISAFMVLKYMELSEVYFSESFFFTGILFVAVLLTGNVFFFRYITRLSGDDALAADLGADSEVEQEVHEGNNFKQSAAKQQREAGLLAAKIVSTVVTIVGIFIGSISLIGLIFLASFFADPEYVLLTISLLFTIPMIFIPKINGVIRYTVLTIGYIAGIVSILWIDVPGLSAPFLLLAATGWIRLDGLYQRLITYFIFNLVMGITLFQTHITEGTHQFTYDLLFLLAVNVVVYGVSHLVKNVRTRNHLRGSGLYFSLIILFILTFMPSIFDYSHLIMNLVYFLLTSWLVVRFIQRERHADSTLSLVFWFAFVAFQYYDVVWKLLHKSFTLLALGVIVFAVMLFLEGRMKSNHGASTLEAESGRGLPYTKLISILLILALQFGFIGYQTVSNERLLANGTSIKLELQPVDPRSLLQGDYVQLSYAISTPEADGFVIEKLESQQRVKVVLRQDANGLHVFDRLYQEGEALQVGEVMLTGRTDGWRSIHYGIESYFVPEGTGLEVERNAKFAIVRVGTSGNALLEKLVSE